MSGARTGPRIAVIYHSRRGTMRRLATAAAAGARNAGATVRLLRVSDTLDDPFAPGPFAQTGPGHPIASPDDVLWADGLVLATPTYFGNVSAPFKAFLDSTARLWAKGLLADRVVTGMTSAECAHGGREATLLTLYQTAYHWGSWVLGAAGGPDRDAVPHATAYGLSATYRKGAPPEPADIRGAWALGGRLTALAGRTSSTFSTSSTSRAPRTAPRPPAPRPTRVTVVHHAHGDAVRTLAQECAAGARDVGVEVRLRRVPDPADNGGSANGRAYAGRWGTGTGRGWTAPRSPVATTEDLEWADAVVFGAPARLGALSAPLLAFAQTLEAAGDRGPLAGKPTSAFTVTPRPHAGSESALLAFHHVLFHCGAVVVPPGYTDAAAYGAGGNPYGAAHALSAGERPSEEVLLAVRHQGRRAALAGDRLRRAVPDGTPETSYASPSTPPAPSPSPAPSPASSLHPAPNGDLTRRTLA